MRHKIIIICFLTFFLQGNGLAPNYQPEPYCEEQCKEDVEEVKMLSLLDFEKKRKKAQREIDKIKKEQEEIHLLIMLKKLKQINIAAE